MLGSCKLVIHFGNRNPSGFVTSKYAAETDSPSRSRYIRSVGKHRRCGPREPPARRGSGMHSLLSPSAAAIVGCLFYEVGTTSHVEFSSSIVPVIFLNRAEGRSPN